PKVELHVHLEGSMRPATLLALARRHGLELPARDEAGLQRWFRFRDFDHFVEVYLTCSQALVDAEDFRLLALDFMAEMERQNVVYAEAHFTIGTHLANGRDGEELRQALAEGVAEGERKHFVRLRLITDIVRNVPQMADHTLEWALSAQGPLVAALGLSGYEAVFPSHPFREHFEYAERQGLHRVAHAGEHAGPGSVRAALEVCGAERIGHGVRSVEDPGLVDELARGGVPLEICPSSNLRLGVVKDLTSHPFDRLYRSGVPVTVNSDDPPFFDTTLTDEYRRLAAAFGYGPAELAGFSLTALRHSFLPAEEKAMLEQEFRRQFDELGRELLGEPVVPAA
ncbi:MAG: adenosine deaminase, partial [Thermoanaerobaculia bacterium]